MREDIAMTTETRHSVAVWFELPATDFDRACAFWQAVMGTTLKGETMGPMRMAVFPYEKPNISGAVIAGPGYRPGAEGPVVYVNVDAIGLDVAVERVKAAGGRIATPRVDLPGGMGAFVHVIDTEGNRVGLHAA
jgi:predicted enzyme related to lactoylglutathione lyase